MVAIDTVLYVLEPVDTVYRRDLPLDRGPLGEPPRRLAQAQHENIAVA